jgi:hypothetical protein
MISIDPTLPIGEVITAMLEDMFSKNVSGITVIMVPDNPDNRDRRPVINITIQMVDKDRVEEVIATMTRDTTSAEETTPH